MINLNYLNIDLDKARKEHYDFFHHYIIKKLETAFQFNKHKNIFKKFLLAENKLDDLIIGKPACLVILNNKFKELVNSNFGDNSYDMYLVFSEKERANLAPKNIHKFFLGVGKIIDYSALKSESHYNSYSLTSNLGVRSCVYCNRVYAVTQSKRTTKGRLMNPQLDHWFPQSKYPLLQISFHNLIPSCEICNTRVKKDNPFNLCQYFHPYQDNPASIEFAYRYSYLKGVYQVFFKNYSDDKILKTCKEMCIDQMYDAHSEEVEDLVTLKREYSDAYLESLRNAFPAAMLSKELQYRLAFGTELLSENFHKRPMSKFKHDILKDLGILI